MPTPPEQPDATPRPAPPVRNHVETRIIRFATLTLDPSSVIEQATIPRHHLFADALIQFGEAVPELWGPLMPWLAGRRVVLEAVSRSLTGRLFAKYVAEALLFGVQWERPHGTRLLVVCRHRPGRLFAALGARVRAGACAGIWHIELPLDGEAVILVPGLVPDAPGHSALRLFFGAQDDDEASERFSAFEDDPMIPAVLKDAIRWSFAMEQLPATEPERTRGFAEAVKHARAAGEARGEARAALRAREEFLTLARDLLGTDGVAGLDAIKSPSALRAEIWRRVEAQRSAG
jgi:hypothetical protein